MIHFFLSPSKTMKLQKNHEIQSQPLYATQALRLRALLAKLDQAELAQLFKISAKQAELVASYYQATAQFAALDLYQGSVFQQLQPEAYSVSQRHYLQTHVQILSAMYGCVRPFDGLQPYRLDLKQSLPELGQSLTTFWQQELEFDPTQTLLINLASAEFAKLLPKTAITIDFVEAYSAGKAKRLATYAKIARGQFLHACIVNEVQTVEQLQALGTARYCYSPEHSTAQHFVYLARTQ